jgi:glycosyltransferase involved in cell wall biosynthesis
VLRRAGKLLEHVPDMLRYRAFATSADLVHFQWVPLPSLDRRLLPDRPLVVTAHDLLPREPRPGQVRAQRRLYEAADALITHSQWGRARLIEMVGVDRAKVRVIHHGALEHLARQPAERPLPAALEDVAGPVVLFFGLLRPYKGLEVLLRAWQGLEPAELWIVGRPHMPLAPLQALAPPGVRFLARYVPEPELPAYFRRADVVVLPYLRTDRFDHSGVLAAALAFGKATVLSEVGGFPEVAANTGAAVLVPPNDHAALRAALGELIVDPDARERLSEAALRAAAGPYSWAAAAERTLSLYRELTGSP